MSMEQETSEKEIRRIVRLLDKTSRIVREASVTESLQGGREYVIQQYNGIVAHLREKGIVLPGYFPDLGPDASFDAVGIACAQLAEYLRADLTDEWGPWEAARRKHGRSVNIIGNVGDLKEIGELIRESLPEWIRAAREKREGREPSKGPSPTPPGAERGPIAAPPSSGLQGNLSDLTRPYVVTQPDTAAAEDLQRRLGDISARMQVVAEQMQQPGLPPEELQRLAGELSRLGREQAEIAGQAAGRGDMGPAV